MRLSFKYRSFEEKLLFLLLVLAISLLLLNFYLARQNPIKLHVVSPATVLR